MFISRWIIHIGWICSVHIQYITHTMFLNRARYLMIFLPKHHPIYLPLNLHQFLGEYMRMQSSKLSVFWPLPRFSCKSDNCHWEMCSHRIPSKISRPQWSDEIHRWYGGILSWPYNNVKCAIFRSKMNSLKLYCQFNDIGRPSIFQLRCALCINASI